MKIEALVFDLGGVVIEIDFDRVFARWAQLAGVDFAHVNAHFSHGEAYQAHERGEIDAATYFQSLRDTLGIDLADADFEDGWQRLFGPEIAGTVELLRQLEGRVPQYLFSNTNRVHHDFWSVRHAAALAPLHRHFVSCEMGVRKPEREAFEYVAREIGRASCRERVYDDV